MNETKLDAKYIMNLPKGSELDAAVSKELEAYVIIDQGCEPYQPAWSTEEAVDLMDILEEYVSQVGIMRCGPDAPNIISQFATIGSEGETTFAYTADWKESMSKAFLLYANGHHGDFFDPEWQRQVDSAPKRLRRVK